MTPLPLCTVLIYSDGSSRAEDLIRLTCELIGPRARIIALAVTLVPLSLPLQGLPDDVDREARSALHRAENIARLSGWKIETRLHRARDLASAIVLEAERVNADVVLLALGPPRFSWQLPRLSRLIRSVMRQAPCPTLVSYFPSTNSLEAAKAIAAVEQFLNTPR